MQELDWIKKLNKENKTREVSITIENYRNIRKKINFKFIKGGITIIVGKNNVGKTNILNYIYKLGEKWSGFGDDAYLISQKGNYLHKFLPLFFGNDKPIFSEKHEKISSLIEEDNSWNIFSYFSRPSPNISIKESKIRYFYKLYYLDLKTFFGFLDSESEGDETPKKIKIGGCRLKYAENYDEKTLERKAGAKSLIWGEKIAEKEESWKIKFSGDSMRSIVREKETNTINYRAFNESMDEFHKIANIGSGHLKFKKIETLFNSLMTSNPGSSPGEICETILLIDELELLLHPSLIVASSNLIKDLKKSGITIIFSTHSPALLSQFACEEGVNFALVKSEKNKRKQFLLGEVVYFWDIVKEIQGEVEKVWKSYCDCLKNKLENDTKFYHNYWRSLLNEYTLKIFFAEKIIFVEGPSDYILLTSEFSKKEIPSLNEVEIVPIFGKSNYIFFDKIAEHMKIKRWTLLDIDKVRGISQNEEEKSECDGSELNTKFWDLHKGKLNFEDIKDNKIFHTLENRISWFPKNIEKFLLLKNDKEDKYWAKRHWWTSKEARMIGNISSNGFLKERFEELKRELKMIVMEWMEDERYQISYFPLIPIKKEEN